MKKLLNLLRIHVAKLVLVSGVFLLVSGLLSFDSSVGCGYSKTRPSPRGRLVGCEGTVSYYYSNKEQTQAGLGAALLMAGIVMRKKKS